MRFITVIGSNLEFLHRLRCANAVCSLANQRRLKTLSADNYNGYNGAACYCTDKPRQDKFPLQSPQYAIFTQFLSPAHRLALAVGILCLALQISGLAEALRFSRDEIMAGQWWRLLSGNLVHLGYPHLLLNLAGLAVISALLGQSMSVRAWAVTGLISMIGVGLGLLLFDPQLKWYVGLSGVLYGLLLGGAIAEYRQQKLVALLVGFYTIGKIVWEQLHGAVESSEKITGGAVIVNAHLYGMVAGAIAVLMVLGLGRLVKQRRRG